MADAPFLCEMADLLDRRNCDGKPSRYDLFSDSNIFTAAEALLGHYGTYVGLTKETAETLDAHTIEEYTKGSKALFVAWVCYATLIWSLKAVCTLSPTPYCILIF